MTRRDPKRLRVVAGSALERQALASAAEEEPSPELSNRMARALGVSAAAVGGAAVAAATARAAASKAAASAAASTTSILPWLSAGVAVVVVAGAIMGAQVWRASVRTSPATAPAGHPSGIEPVTAVEGPVGAPTTAVPARVAAPSTETVVQPEVPTLPSGRRARSPSNPPDLRDQTLLVDAARNAVASGAANKALSLVRQYQERYPGGIFVPEVAALKIEALARLGRSNEARALAERFVASHGAGPLTERVKGVAGLTRP